MNKVNTGTNNNEDNYEGEEVREKIKNETVDMRLRRYGFTIHSRPSIGEAVWTKLGRVYTQSAAEEIVNGMLLSVQTN